MSLKERIEKAKVELSLHSLKNQVRNLISGIDKKDILLIAIFPLIIFLVMLLPLWIRESLELNIENPSCGSI